MNQHQRHRAFLAALSLLLVLTVACEKGGPVLEENAVITISADPNTVLNFGDTAIVNVRAFEADGRPVLDGARIQLTASSGSITGEVRTNEGLAQGIFTSGATPGTVTITAQSGQLGGDGTVTTEIEVIDRDELAFRFKAVKPTHVDVHLPNRTGPLRQAEISNLLVGDQ